ncbi:MAG: hypothetical protein QOJ03_237 [Frankiaceae bacterium]|jgi:hypothetical protein|nr:hypothetical protein [Frankiaceae bacterium]
MRRLAGWAAALVVAATAVTASGASTTWTHGYDVSWPQCHGAAAHHLPTGSPRFVILGLTHGAGHTANPCLSSQLAWARQRGSAVGAYLVPSYPTARQRQAAATGAYGTCTTLRCRLHNDGAAQAADAVGVMTRVGLPVPMVWVDVEFRSNPAWSGKHARNRSVLEGVLRGLNDAGIRYGVYTTSYMWAHIAGSWRLDVPNWLPSGNGSSATAKSRCRTTGTGGRTWLAQYTREWDENLTCPVMDAAAGSPGPLWRYRNTALQLGSSGAAVTALQHRLRLGETGQYDAPTALAVVRFQRSAGLPMTGTIDGDDWRALGAFRRVGGHPFLLSRMTTR